MRVPRGAAAVAGALVLSLAGAAAVLAADDVPTEPVVGTVVGLDGAPADVVSARVEEYETPDADPVVSTFEVAADGTFTVALRVWGTAGQPGRAVFTVLGERSDPVFDENGCWTTTTQFGTLEIAIPGAVPSEPLEIVVDRAVEEGLCPAETATPAPSRPSVTLPPTDSVPGAMGAGANLSAGDALLVLGIWILGLGSLMRSRRPAR
jgi:hypothetical protein